MSFLSFLNESPFVGQDTEFSLNTKKGNLEMAQEFLAKTPSEIYEDTDERIFARYGKPDKGNILFINKNKKLILYFVEYKTLSIKGVKSALTQTKVWRSEDLPIHGTARKVFFDILFKINKAIISDSDQTKNGQSFWKKQMASGHEDGYWVGLYDEDEWTIDWCSPSEDFLNWKERAYEEGWSSSDTDKAKYRFIIAKNKF